MPRTTALLLPTLLLLAATACGRAVQASGASASAPMTVDEASVRPRMMQNAQTQERQIVQTAGLSLVAEDLPAVARAADSLATALGGYVQNSQQRGGNGLTMTLRVPAPSLAFALDRLGAMGRVSRRSVNRQDVTDQAVDVEARLTTLRTLRDRLREHLSRAGAVADLMAVERELARVQGEIDALEAQQRGLQGRVALASITLDAERPQVLGPLGWLLKGVAELIGKLFVIR